MSATAAGTCQKKSHCHAGQFKCRNTIDEIGIIKKSEVRIRGLQKQRQHPRIAIQAIPRDLAVGIEPHEGDLAQDFADQLQFTVGFAKHVLAATEAGEVECAFDVAARTRLEFADHALQIFHGGAAVAFTKHDRAVGM